MMDKNENAMILGNSPLLISDVASLIKAGELDKSIPFMAYNRATRRTAEKQAKKMIRRSKDQIYKKKMQVRHGWCFKN